MNKRIIGIDVARALAVIGMIIVNFKIVLGDHGENWLKDITGFLSGKAAATFVVLAGVGMALMTKKALEHDDQLKLKINKLSLAKRAIFLFVIGLSYMWIWPADILHYYGIYMLLSLLLIHRHPRFLLISSGILILIYPILLVLFNYETGWNFSTLEYLDFWTLNGFIRNLLYNGFHPVVPWTAFMLVGIWFGRQDLNDQGFIKRSFWISTIGFVLIQLISFVLIRWLSDGNVTTQEELVAIFGTEPMPPMPLYMLNGILFSIMLICSCIIIAWKFPGNVFIDALKNTGKLALTFYVAHVVIGMGLIEEWFDENLGEYSIYFSVSYAMVFSLICILFAQIWMKYKKSGPLEWLMRKVTK